MKSLENKNPGENKSWTPLYSAAGNGQYKICEHIMKSLENKNPGTNTGWTPLHVAAKGCKDDICQLIVKNVKSGEKKMAHFPKLAINKKSTIFVLSS